MSESSEDLQPVTQRNKLRPFSLESLVGTTLGVRYQIEELIGMGATGAVFRARQLDQRRTVAVRVPRPGLCSRPGFLARFEREALAMAKLVQENIVQVFEVSVHKDGKQPSFIAMEYAGGVDLGRYLSEKEDKLTISAVVALFHQIARGLDAAHERGIVHRNLKPGNICVTHPQHTAKIMDFGAASLEAGDVCETVPDLTIETPSYMAPEQLTGEAVTPATDIYGFGVTIYHLLTRRLPFDAPSAPNMISAHVSTPPIPAHARNPSLPVKVHQSLSLALAKNPADRPKTAKALVRAIQQALQPLENHNFSDLFNGVLNADGLGKKRGSDLSAARAKAELLQRQAPRPVDNATAQQMMILAGITGGLVVVGAIGFLLSSNPGPTTNERFAAENSGLGRDRAADMNADPASAEVLSRPPSAEPEPQQDGPDTETLPSVASGLQVSPETGLLVEVATPAPTEALTTATLIAAAAPSPTATEEPVTPSPAPPDKKAAEKPDPATEPPVPSIKVAAKKEKPGGESSTLQKDAARWDSNLSPLEPDARRREQTRIEIEKFFSERIESPIYHAMFEPADNALALTGAKSAQDLLTSLRNLREANDEVAVSLRIVEGGKFWEDRAELRVGVKVTGRPKGHPDPAYRKALLEFPAPALVRVQKVAGEWRLLSFKNQ